MELYNGGEKLYKKKEKAILMKREKQNKFKLYFYTIEQNPLVYVPGFDNQYI